MTVSVSEFNYKGAIIRHVFKGPVTTTTAAVNKKGKMEYHGPVCLDHLTNSYKYGEEVHLIVYQNGNGIPRYVVREADSTNWCRVETHLFTQTMDSLAKSWLEYRGFTVSK